MHLQNAFTKRALLAEEHYGKKSGI